MKQIAILGFGTVGGGVADIITDSADLIASSVGEPLVLKRILDLRDFPGNRFESLLTKSFEDILNDQDITIVVECLGGKTFAYDYTKRLLAAGKSVITSNKDLVAAYGSELLALAFQNNAHYMFEASVGGGIPIIRPLTHDLKANKIQEIYGILNGTTNYILTGMTDKGSTFEVTLRDAQQLGYAEANPASDVDGKDTANKVSILASLAFGKHVYPETIPTEGIRSISDEDISLALSKGYHIKLIGRTTLTEDGSIYSYVAPHLVGDTNMLSGVNGVFNGIVVRGNQVGDVMFYGRGAGKYPTASAVVADVIDCAKTLDQAVPPLWVDGAVISQGSEQESKWYVRAGETCDASVFGAFEMISASAFITKAMKQHDFIRALDIFKKTNTVVNAFRILD
ncbi:MAG: homoserine dehydrogenase [Clostridia bacterium]|nr:homoserine dehydrogenase [Oscillospiraceae bacterium]MBQ2748840.1 homoserine dehydrogenase [Clostridia bacterium]MBQ4625081.1 homoserine dehydrogenase [Clostridia bacterium]